MTKQLRTVIGIFASVAAAALAHAGAMTWTFAVQLSATARTDPARVELNWTTDPFPVRDYVVQRKGVTDTAWSEPVILGPEATSFTDENVEAGKTYEYQVIRHAATYTAFGYIAVGINAPLVDSRGKVILVVDQSIAEPVGNELKTLEADLAGDGWTVVRKDVARDASPADVRSVIREEWEADREGTKAVLLFGHVPVVRSGNQNVDGHAARPMPADVFYGELNGDWTDVNGDGIYDQSTLPSDMELMVGRVDFSDLPGKYSPIAYPSEVELLKRYIEKNHAYRHGLVRITNRALVGNSIGDGGGQAYAASGYRNFAALVGAANVVTANSEYGAPPEERWIGRLAADDYLWAYACGAGSDFSIGAMGPHDIYGDAWASDFQEKKTKGTFYMMFGSWFVDWSKPDNLMRAALAAPEYGLAAVYSGRPHVFYHHMGIGEPIGYGIRASQNNGGLYQNQAQRQLRGVHLALLGDPTLRMYVLPPARDLVLQTSGNDVILTWSASSDPVVGYHVYRGATANGPFARLTETPLTELRFAEARPGPEAAVYMVRAIALQTGPSGSFFNASQGVTASLDANPDVGADSRPQAATLAFGKASRGAAPSAFSYSLNDANDQWSGSAAAPLLFSATHSSSSGRGSFATGFQRFSSRLESRIHHAQMVPEKNSTGSAVPALRFTTFAQP
jgi:hypothetical protein